MSNRVEELESKVTELQAAINGLTEELVETKERVRQLEEQAADAEADPSPEASSAEFSQGADGDVGAEVTSAPEQTPDDEGDDEEAKAAEDESSDDEGGSGLEDSDIIVA
jgi:uncharacterized protein involved in exopolysaccharide biosynthesis